MTVYDPSLIDVPAEAEVLAPRHAYQSGYATGFLAGRRNAFNVILETVQRYQNKHPRADACDVIAIIQRQLPHTQG